MQTKAPVEGGKKNVIKRLAIIGAGPKGAAIVSKAAALRAAGHHRTPPDIDLYEPSLVGAAWRGTIGYTDGEQPLCTLSERDLGFPYDTTTYGPRVAQAMLSDFSWQSFAIGASGRARYCDWVVNGRNPPRHREFADYLTEAVSKAVHHGAANLVANEVRSVDYISPGGFWRVESTDPYGAITTTDYDGVVITGSGRPQAALPGANARVIDGRAFWKSIPQMQQLLSGDPDPCVLIIGAGGTAAAIAYWFIRKGLTTLPITIVGREATLFSRHDGPFEDRLFTDDVAWQALAPHVREAFLSRTTAAVVWDYVLRNLVSDNITYESYSARGYRNAGSGGPGQPDLLKLEMDAPPDPAVAQALALLPVLGLPALPPFVAPPAAPLTTRPGTVIVDARGFDRWGFADEFFAASGLRPCFDAGRRQQILGSIGHDLSVRGPLMNGAPFPEGLHVPGLGTLQGPAATNLMGLGWLADRVLSRYC
ncbi:L-lysine 6-monooxygenase (NADPH-requiring) [Variovorax sp. YR266]|uniref:SidA/IucD/PvdA family monooxygenase n=1 Tax=Variovorax sp. YR266 TaxID=1884386 RepID=UPI000894943B|nr:SidA/IucD/PvdA family monooxygenase [Variovorax sp. YR266]SDZ70662.1 L-lysine 6-monooxygenase (NADPH-requiring) [Variovorax sp. YR266]